MSFNDPLKQLFREFDNLYNKITNQEGGRIDVTARFDGNNEWLDVSDLVCGYVMNDRLNDSVVKIKDGVKICSAKGERISNVLIKDAISHIFNVDEQFIVELIVNGFDAQSNGNTVGKFGMGFFSALAPIVKVPGTILSIVTRFRLDELMVNYAVKIKFGADNKLKMRMEDHPAGFEFPYPSGTRISYTYEEDISDSELLKLHNEAKKLSFYRKGQLYMSSNVPDIQELLTGEQKAGTSFYKINNTTIIIPAARTNEVYVSLNKREIIILDKGSGINSDVLLTKLLVPASSTKKIIRDDGEGGDEVADIEDAGDRFTYVADNITGLHNRAKDSKIWFNVGGVNVFNEILHDSIVNKDYVFDLELNFNVPVARNDVLFMDDIDLGVFSEHMNKIVSIIVSDTQILSDLERFIEMYGKYTTQAMAYRRIDTMLRTITHNVLEDSTIYPIPSSHIVLRKLITGDDVPLVTDLVIYTKTLSYLRTKLTELTKLFIGKDIYQTTDTDEKFKFMIFNDIVIVNNADISVVLRESLKLKESLIPLIKLDTNTNISTVGEDKAMYRMLLDSLGVSYKGVLLAAINHILKRKGFVYDHHNMLINEEDEIPEDMIERIRFINKNANNIFNIVLSMTNESIKFVGTAGIDVARLINHMVYVMIIDCETEYECKIFLDTIANNLNPFNFVASRPDDYGAKTSEISILGECGILKKSFQSEANSMKGNMEYLGPLCSVRIITFMPDDSGKYSSWSIDMKGSKSMFEEKNIIMMNRLKSSYDPSGIKSLFFPMVANNMSTRTANMQNRTRTVYDKSQVTIKLNSAIKILNDLIKIMENQYGFNSGLVDILKSTHGRGNPGDTLKYEDDVTIESFKSYFKIFMSKIITNMANAREKFLEDVMGILKKLDGVIQETYNDQSINPLSFRLVNSLTGIIEYVAHRIAQNSSVEQYIPYLRRPQNIRTRDNVRLGEDVKHNHDVIKKIRAHRIRDILVSIDTAIGNTIVKTNRILKIFTRRDNHGRTVIDKNFSGEIYEYPEKYSEFNSMVATFNVFAAEYKKYVTILKHLKLAKKDIISLRGSDIHEWIPRMDTIDIHDMFAYDFLFDQYDYDQPTSHSLFDACVIISDYIREVKFMYTVPLIIFNVTGTGYYVPNETDELDGLKLRKDFMMGTNVIRDWSANYWKSYMYLICMDPINMAQLMGGKYHIRKMIEFILSKSGIADLALKISFLLFVMAFTLPGNKVLYTDVSGTIKPVEMSIDDINLRLDNPDTHVEIRKCLLLLNTDDILDVYRDIHSYGAQDTGQISVLLGSVAFTTMSNTIRMLMEYSPDINLMSIDALAGSYTNAEDIVIRDILLSKFIKKIYTLDDINIKTDLQSAMPAGELGLQIVPIAINSGSPNQVEMSVAVELLQNSIDITDEIHELRDWDIRKNIKTFRYKDKFTKYFGDAKDIDINIGYIIHDNGTYSITYENKDYIGFRDDNNIVSLAVPYYSEKTSGTGQMGNGFFNCYRRSNKVLVRSRSDNVNFLITDNVVRTGDIATDINKTFTFYNINEEESFTSAMVEYLPMDKSEFAAASGLLLTELNNAVSSVPYANIKLNGKHIYTDKKGFMLIYASENIKIYIKNNSTESYVLTHGVPFMSLSRFLDKYNIPHKNIHNFVHNGFVIDISNTKYFPVQSRIDAKFDNALLNDIAESLPSMIFLDHMYKEHNGPQTPRIPFFTKNNSIFVMDQYIPENVYNINKISRLDTLIPTFKVKLDEPIDGKDSINISELISYYLVNSPNGNICQAASDFGSWSYSLITRNAGDSININDDEYKLKIQEFNDLSMMYGGYINDTIEELESAEDNIINLMKLYACKWILNKIKNSDTQADSLIDKFAKTYGVEVQRGGYTGDEHKQLIKVFIETYINILQDIGVVDADKDIPTLEEELNPLYLGSYSAESNTLKIQISKNRHHIETLIYNIKKNRANASLQLRSNEAFKIMFSGHTESTLIHELEHYRRGDGHYNGEDMCSGSGGHNSTTETINGINKERTFDECIRDIYTLSIENELIDKFVANYLAVVDA